MSFGKRNITLKFDSNKHDNASDSLTTYSLMAVLSGTIFTQIIISDTSKIFISELDKMIIVTTSLISVCLILIAVESVIDIFHFTENNDDKQDLITKYKKQLIYYNLGVLFLVATILYCFWAFVIKDIINTLTSFCVIPQSLCLCNRYLILLILFTISFLIIGRKWIKDLKFIKKANIEIK